MKKITETWKEEQKSWISENEKLLSLVNRLYETIPIVTDGRFTVESALEHLENWKEKP